MTPTAGVRAPRLWKYVGSRIREARISSDMTDVQFALRVRLTRQMIHEIERGNKGTRIEVLYRIAEATGRPIGFFLPNYDDI